MIQYKTIAESNNFIVLDQYNKFVEEPNAGYQTEGSLEREFIRDLQAQGYEYLQGLNNHDELIKNLRFQLQRLNNVVFSDAEWRRFLEEYLDKPSDSLIEKTRKIHDNYIYDFVFDDGHIQNIYLLDKKNIANNAVQVINQFEQTGSYDNRYDVTILVNGLPLVHVELKKRGVAIREAFNQIHRYSKESFNKENSLFKYIIHGGISLLKYVSIYNILSFFVFNDKTTEYLRKETDLDWYLMILAISPKYQGQNVGSKFLNYIDTFVMDNNGKSLSFVTNIEKNKHFYSKNKYENVNYKELDFRGKKVDNWSFRKIYK